MAGCGGIQNEYLYAIVFNYIKHRCLQISCIKRNRLSRLQIDFQVVFVTHMHNAFFKPLNVIVCPCDVVSASHIEPLKSIQQISEFLLYRCKSRFERIRILFTERVKMKTLNT